MCKLLASIVLLCSCVVNSGFSTEICNFNVVLEQYLTNEGFHRNLTYEITFGSYDGPHLYEGCLVGLDQKLPSGVFANSDELEDLGRVNKLSAVLNNRVNTELPAEHSQPSNVYVMGELSDSVARLWLPVHGRYHAAKSKGGFAHNEISSPELYLRCPDNRLKSCDVDTSTTVFCNDKSKKKCTWKRIPHTVLTSPLNLSVPVGSSSDHPLVASVTVTVVVAGSLYLLKTLHEYKIAKRKKKT